MMNDDELIQTMEPVIEIPPDLEPLPDPEPTAPPMEVIPVDDLLDRLAELLGEEDAPEESDELNEMPVEDPVVTVDGDIDLPVVDPDPTVVLVESVIEHLLDMIVDLGKIEKHLDEVEKDMVTVVQAVDHPALTTSFEDYTVTEALLLLLLLFAFLSACARVLRGGLKWLRS